MNQRTFLGLTHNPFVPPKEGFFNGADRKTHLEHLRHLSQWSRRILVVSGPFGIGKSTLFRELSANLEPHTKAARLAGTVVTTEREVLSALLQGFGVAADASSGADDLADVIAKFVDEQEENGRACMVMVDDGHLLEPGALQRLIGLVAGSSLRMVVFAETTVIGAIDRDSKAANLEWFEIRLTGFPKSDVRDYLEWRFSQAQYRGLLPFTDEQLEMIVTKSSGNPGVVDSLASNLLIEMETGQIRNRSSGFPIMHGVLAILLVAFVGLLYVWFQRSMEDAPVAPDTAAAQSAPAEQVTQIAAAQQELEPSPVTDDKPVPMPDEPGQSEVTQEPRTADDTSEPEDDWVQDEFGAVTDLGSTPSSAEPQRRAVGETPAAAGATPGEQTAFAREPEPDIPSGDIPSGNKETDQSAPSVAVTEPAVAEVESAAADDSGIKGASWLLNQDPRAYTVQLVTVSRPERAQELINEQAQPSEFAVYQINRDGRRLNVITYGVFSTTGAATQAAGGLTGQLATVKPWVRPMNLVQDAVRAGL